MSVFVQVSRWLCILLLRSVTDHVVRLFVCLPGWLFVCLSVYLFVYLFVCLCVHLFVIHIRFARVGLLFMPAGVCACWCPCMLFTESVVGHVYSCPSLLIAKSVVGHVAIPAPIVFQTASLAKWIKRSPQEQQTRVRFPLSRWEFVRVESYQ